MANNYRDRDIRNQIHDLLMATGAFDDVYITGSPEDSGQSSSDLKVAWIEPSVIDFADQWDAVAAPEFINTGTLRITFAARHQDPQQRDELAEQLLMVAANTIQRISVGGWTIVATTGFKRATFRPAQPPERRIECTYSYQYLADGLDQFGADD